MPLYSEYRLLVPMRDNLVFSVSYPKSIQASLSIGLSSLPIFRLLSVEHIVTVFEAIVVESKIVFSSAHLCLLNVAAETFVSFLYPLKWHHAYIPVLPSKLKDFVHAPFPFIIGIHPSIIDEIPSDVVVVDLDRNSVKIGDHMKCVLSSRARKKLETKLRKYAFDVMTVSKDSNDLNWLINDARLGWITRYKDLEKLSNKVQDERKFLMDNWMKRKNSNASEIFTVKSQEFHAKKSRNTAGDVSKELPSLPDDNNPRQITDSIASFSRNTSFNSLRTDGSNEDSSRKDGSSTSDHSPTVNERDLSKSPHIHIKRFITQNIKSTPMSMKQSIGNMGSQMHVNDENEILYFYNLKVTEESSQVDEYLLFHSTINIPRRFYAGAVDFHNLTLTKITCTNINNELMKRFNLKQSDDKYQLQPLVHQYHRLYSVFLLQKFFFKIGRSHIYWLLWCVFKKML
jgi:hypothetical protein